MKTVADESEDSNSVASDNISEASTERSDENALPFKSATRMETSLFHVSPYKNLTPEQSRTWIFTGEDSESESYGDENQSPEELHTKRNTKEYIMTTSSFSPYSETSKSTSHRRCRSVALSPSIAPPPKKLRGNSSTGEQYSRTQSKDNPPRHRRSQHAGLTVGIPVCYVDGNNPEPPARASRGITNGIVGVFTPARLFMPVESSGIVGFWGDESWMKEGGSMKISEFSIDLSKKECGWNYWQVLSCNIALKISASFLFKAILHLGSISRLFLSLYQLINSFSFSNLIITLCGSKKFSELFHL